MKYKIVYFALAMFLSVPLAKAQTHSSPKGIQFQEGSWADIKAKAKKEHKPIFVDAFTVWCGPCKRMAKQVFPLEPIGDYYNKTFVSYALDMENGEGPEFAKRYMVQYYPTFLFFNENGELMHKSVGSMSYRDFLALGKEAIDSNQNLYGMMKKFKSGEKDPTFLKNLLKKSYQVDDELSNMVLNAYWATQSDKDLINPENWEIFKTYEQDINSKQYAYILEHKQEFSAKYGTDVIEKDLFTKAGLSMKKAAKEKNPALFKKAVEVMDKAQNLDVIRYGLFSQANYYLDTKQWDKFTEKAQQYAKEYPDDDVSLNQLAWSTYKATDDKKLLADALSWAKKSVDVKKEYYNMDTYAALLLANAEFDKAEQAALEAIELAKKDGEDYSETQSLIVQIKKRRGH